MHALHAALAKAGDLSWGKKRVGLNQSGPGFAYSLSKVDETDTPDPRRKFSGDQSSPQSLRGMDSILVIAYAG